MPLIVGAAFLLLLLMLGRAYVGTDSGSLVKAVRVAGSALLALVALFLGFTGRIGPAVFVGLIAWALLMGREMPWKRDPRFGAGGARQQAPPPSPPGGMSRAEALKVLGLEPGATTDEIRAAHRRLILQNHPDKGGSSYLAAKINQAKDVLLG
jgi:hypothetical protein